MMKSRINFFSIITLIFLNVGFCLQADHAFVPHPDNKSQARDCKIALACVFKDEAPWLREWLEFHRLIGINHFYLYNNLSTDNYLKVLQPYLNSGVVEIFDYPASSLSTEDQPKIYTHAVNLAKDHHEWLAIIDTDEFITPVTTNDLSSYLETFPNDVGGVEISWQCYGTSNIWSLIPKELLIEKLTLKAPANDPVNMWYKSIVRPHCVAKVESAHNCSYNPGYRAERVTPCIGPGPAQPVNEASVKDIRINHYLWRTKEFFYTVKLPRIKRWNVNHFKIGSPIDYLSITNQVEDLSIQKYVPALRARMFKHPGFHPNGYWLGKDSSLQHAFDLELSNYLSDFFVKENAGSIADFGCGTGEYLGAWRAKGLNCEGYDGNPETSELTNGAGRVLDLSQPADLKKHYDWIVSFDVGQQIPAKYEGNFIANLVNHCDKGIILSWSVRGQKGECQVNQHDNHEIKKMMAELGFSHDVETENRIRASTSLPWFKNTLMVFRKL